MKYYLIAGEASGDLHGSKLMRALYEQDSQADIRFWGGALMDEVYREHQSGNGFVKDYREGAVLGIWEILTKWRYLARQISFCKQDIKNWKPDAVILIDYPGFNFRIAHFAHDAHFRVYYYIAPKLWASREGRIRKLKAWTDRLFIIFPFEIEYFASKGVPCTYVGNPLIDAIDQCPDLKEEREDLPSIALLAGSRDTEISSMMPVYMDFADLWHKAHPEYRFIVAAAPSRKAQDYDRYIGDRDYVSVVFGKTYSVLRNSRAAVINSGTASLEAALIGTPQVVGYRIAPLTYIIARSFLKVKYISLANLILDKAAFKELIQDYLTPENLFWEVTRLTGDGLYRSAMLEDYAKLREMLGGSGASKAVAKAIIEENGKP